MKGLKKLIVSDKGFYRQVIMLALPIALQSMITIGVNMLDTIMVNAISDQDLELSATSLANQFISIYHILCMGLGMGASVLVSRYWGMKEREPERATEMLKKTVCLVIRVTLGLAFVFCMLTVFMPEKIMEMYGDNPEINPLGVIYLRYSVVTYFFLGLSLVCTIVLRSVGQVRLPLYVSIGAFFVNLGANYVLIFGKFGFPRMEIAGAALGTLIARVFETAMICGYLLFVDKKICFRVKNLFMKVSDLLGEYFRISIPVLISDGILAFGNNAVSMVIGRLEEQKIVVDIVAANAITAVTQQISTVAIQGVSQAGAIVVGQTLGRGDKEKTMEQGYGFLGLGVGLGAISAIIILAISAPVIRAYGPAEHTAQIAQQLMFAISFIMLFQAMNSIMTKGVLRGGGDTRMLMLTDNVFLWVISIPLGIIAGFVFKLPAFFIYVALKFDQIVKAFWCIFRLRSGKWIKKIGMGKQTGRQVAEK